MLDDTTVNKIKCFKCLNFNGTASNFRHVIIVFNKSQKTIFHVCLFVLWKVDHMLIIASYDNCITAVTKAPAAKLPFNSI